MPQLMYYPRDTGVITVQTARCNCRLQLYTVRYRLQKHG